jgi:hypothetical protein
MFYNWRPKKKDIPGLFLFGLLWIALLYIGVIFA